MEGEAPVLVLLYPHRSSDTRVVPPCGRSSSGDPSAYSCPLTSPHRVLLNACSSTWLLCQLRAKCTKGSLAAALGSRCGKTCYYPDSITHRLRLQQPLAAGMTSPNRLTAVPEFMFPATHQCHESSILTSVSSFIFSLHLPVKILSSPFQQGQLMPHPIIFFSVWSASDLTPWCRWDQIFLFNQKRIALLECF